MRCCSGWSPLLLVAPAALGLTHRGVGMRVLDSRVAIAVGTVSYGVFLWHYSGSRQLQTWGAFDWIRSARTVVGARDDARAHAGDGDRRAGSSSSSRCCGSRIASARQPYECQARPISTASSINRAPTRRATARRARCGRRAAGRGRGRAASRITQRDDRDHDHEVPTLEAVDARRAQRVPADVREERATRRRSRRRARARARASARRPASGPASTPRPRPARTPRAPRSRPGTCQKLVCTTTSWAMLHAVVGDHAPDRADERERMTPQVRRAARVGCTLLFA